MAQAPTITSRIRSALAALLALSALFLAIWIVVPGPTSLLVTLSVGAPEISAWLFVLSLAAGGLALVDVPRHGVSRLALGMATPALVLSALPLVQFPGARRRFDAEVGSSLGVEMLGGRPDFARASPLSIPDLFGGIPLGAARLRRGVPVATVGGVPLTVDIYQPGQSGPRPIIVQIYGGSWQRGDPSSFSNGATWLASHGYVVFAIDYRHAPAFHWPAQLADVRSALSWIAIRAAEYHADTSRVLLIGRSAGAQLALMAAYTPGPLRISGVVSYYGPVDLVDAYRHPPRPDPLQIRGIEETLFGATLDSLPARYREASPINYATHPLPPTLLIYGGRDHIVEPRYGRRMRDSLVATGTKVAYLEIPWADHAFDEVFSGPSNQLALYYLERFAAWALTPAHVGAMRANDVNVATSASPSPGSARATEDTDRKGHL